MPTHYAPDYEEITGRKVGEDTYDAPDVPETNVQTETFYADDYEALTGRERDGSIRDGGDKTVSAKVVEPGEKPEPKKSTAKVETK